ncbi:hypothetical protein KFK09_020774 [Dendrobium nobile]|uniref:Uncharacterized protein n=1 Tax=Dendrobium nobile TaxID=94219 RepID=A0A8T3AML7_DENNO|nr:hypothetical protein KFK09_020774 [Dendrobium nobile]
MSSPKAGALAAPYLPLLCLLEIGTPSPLSFSLSFRTRRAEVAPLSLRPTRVTQSSSTPPRIGLRRPAPVLARPSSDRSLPFLPLSAPTIAPTPDLQDLQANRLGACQALLFTRAAEPDARINFHFLSGSSKSTNQTPLNRWILDPFSLFCPTVANVVRQALDLFGEALYSLLRIWSGGY